MSGNIDKTFYTPVQVDERFLVNADQTVRECMVSLNEEIAAAFNVDAQKLKRYVAGQRIPSNVSDRHRYERARQAFSTKTTVRWRNHLSEEFADIGSAIKALESEHSKPYSILVRGGEYGYPSISLALRDHWEQTVDLRASGNRDSLRVVSEKVASLLKNSSPDFAILHHPHCKAGLLILAATGWFMGLLALPSILRTDEILTPLRFFGPAGWFTLTIMAASALYFLAFPSIVFDFGGGKSAITSKRLVLAAFGIVVATMLAFSLPTPK